MTMALNLSLLVLALASVGCWFFYWKNQARLFANSGHVPPATSWFGILGYAFFSYLLTFVAVGPVKVIRKGRMPKGRIVCVGPHQQPCDFAMMRRGSGRHFRMLTDSAQLEGFFGLLCAAGGVISVGFKNKGDGAAAEEACKRSLSAHGFRLPLPLALTLWAMLGAGFVASVHFGLVFAAIACVILSLVVAGCPGSAQALGIFPQGGLLPDDPDFLENFRPGAVRIAREAAERSGESVFIVPTAIVYGNNPKNADWTHRYLKGMRSMFGGLRNPKGWDPIFKLNLEELSEAERVAVEAERAAKMLAFKKSKSRNYGGCVIRGEAIDLSSLPADPIAAIEVVKAKVVALQMEARSHC